MDPSQELPTPEDAIPEPKKTLGSYRCGGRCDDRGFIKGEDHVPCSKCRVYDVSGSKSMKEFIQIFGSDARYVRARTALEAMQIFAKSNPEMVKFSARRHNRDYGEKSVTIEYSRQGDEWKRLLSRPSVERAMEILAGRIFSAMKVAEKTWKVPGGKVAGIVKRELDEFMRERSLVFVSKTPCTCGPAMLAVGKVSATCKAKEHK